MRITVGTNLSHSVGRSVYLKIDAEMQIQVLGRKIESLSPEEAHLAEAGNQDFLRTGTCGSGKVMGKG